MATVFVCQIHVKRVGREATAILREPAHMPTRTLDVALHVLSALYLMTESAFKKFLAVVLLHPESIVQHARMDIMARLVNIALLANMDKLMEAFMAMDSVCLDHVKQDGLVATATSAPKATPARTAI